MCLDLNRYSCCTWEKIEHIEGTFRLKTVNCYVRRFELKF